MKQHDVTWRDVALILSGGLILAFGLYHIHALSGITEGGVLGMSLLLRHPDAAPAEDFIRAVVKAADAGRQPFERLCGQLHAAFAERLRRHEKLPGALLPYLCQAYQMFYQ